MRTLESEPWSLKPEGWSPPARAGHRKPLRVILKADS
jgi:hypothetical protein